MSSEVQSIIGQIVILTLLGMTGFVAGKKKYLPDDTHKYLSTFILKITMPLLLITTIGNYSFTKETLINGMYIFLFGIVFVLLSGVIATGSSKLMSLKDKVQNMYIAQSMFGNVIFMAYPLFKAMYGDQGIVYAIFFNLANDAILWTLGVYLFNRHKTKNWKENISHLVNPNTLAFLGGLIIMMFKTVFKVDRFEAYNRLWDVIYNTFNPLGHTTIYISMIFIGLILSNIKIQGMKDVVSKMKYLALAISKLLVVPAIALLFFTLTNGFFDEFVVKIVVLQLAMPTGTIVSALALQYDSDYNAATEGIFFTTILSILTLPLMVYLLSI